MSKASKQKNKQGNAKSHHQPSVPIAPTDAQLAAQLAATVREAAQAESNPEPKLAVDAQPSLVTKPTAAQELRAALLAKQQQPKQWKQQLKAGRMVGAQVPKRFNRGG